METDDVVVIGAGIVGLATARSLLVGSADRPRRSVLVVDKEGSIAGHQTGRNSGVIHAGVYDVPGSERARLCTAGGERMVPYCREHGIANEVCGKVVVAVTDDERSRLTALHERCVANSVDVELIGPGRLAELEPHVRGVAALHVKVTGIADYPAVCRSMVAEIEAMGGRVQLGSAVIGASSDGRSTVVGRRPATCALARSSTVRGSRPTGSLGCSVALRPPPA